VIRGRHGGYLDPPTRGGAMPGWLWILLIVLIVLFLFGGFGYARR
jgi:hypothetical protein